MHELSEELKGQVHCHQHKYSRVSYVGMETFLGVGIISVQMHASSP
jgi:hypothetical protein